MRRFLILFLLPSSYLVYSQDCEKENRYENGVLMSASQMVGDTCITTVYWPNGQLKQQYQELSGALVGESFSYCENGTLIIHLVYDDSRPQQLRVYYCSGRPKIVARYFGQPNSFVGDYVEFHENGVVKTIGQYHIAVKPYHGTGVKSGKWTYWNDAGELIKDEIYRNGALFNLKEY